MLWKRTLTALILIPFVIFLVYRGGHFYVALVILVTVLMLIEFSGISRAVGAGQSRALVIISGFLLCLPAIEPIGQTISIQVVLIFILFLAFSYPIFRDRTNGAFLSVGSTMVGAIYIGWAFGYHLISLRHIGNLADKEIGSRLVYFLLVIIWCNDTAAYLCGKRFGKHKLRPQISPGKTIEGTIAGLGFGTIGGIAAWYFLGAHILSLPHVVILSVLLGAVSQFSDLSESVIKRSAAVKDSGRLIPGHGGLLDRCDSLIFSAPTLYYYVQYVIAPDG